MTAIEKLALSIPEAVHASGFSRSSLYEEISAGRLRAIKRGRRIAILTIDFRTWLESLPEARGSASARGRNNG
jgi:predicted DNA-binding transcriptional regulator AlpA